MFALEDIKKGAFIVEYVGELLDEEEYLRRKEYYHSVGQRHYYFMNIGNGEVCSLLLRLFSGLSDAVFLFMEGAICI